jgi:hypothetical protein
VAVHVLALAAVVAQLVRGGKILGDGQTPLASHNHLSLQAVEKRPIAALLQKGQILTYWKYASALSFFRALHSNIFEQPAKMIFSMFS